MSDFEYDFWQCGHITDIRDGIRVSENGDLTVPALTNVSRDAIERPPHSLCPRCHADRLISRLKDIKTLLTDCILRREEDEINERKFNSIKNFLLYNSQERFIISPPKWEQYPEEFIGSERHTLKLELSVCDMLISDYTAGKTSRLRARAAQFFVGRIIKIGEEAAARAKELRGTDGNSGMKKCLFDIMEEVKSLVEEIESAGEAETRYLEDLRARGTDLRIVFDGYDSQMGRPYDARTGRYSSDESQ